MNVITSWCHCWRLTRRDGIAFGFTDHDRPLVIGGESFEPDTGLTASEARASLGLGADAMDVAGALSSGRIDEADILAGAYDRAVVETFLVDWRDPALDRLLARAVVGRLRRSDGAFVAELESPLVHLDGAAGRWYRRRCDATLGDHRCRVDLDRPGLTALVTVAARPGANLVRVTGLSGFAPGWFTDGMAHPPGGGPYRIEAHRSEGAQALLQLDRLADLEAGTTLRLTAGCDRHFATCRKKFNNSVNFRGFPHLPGNDAVYAYASEGATFDGGPLVP